MLTTVWFKFNKLISKSDFTNYKTEGNVRIT